MSNSNPLIHNTMTHEELIVKKQVKKFPTFREKKVWLTCSKEYTSGSYPVSNKSSPYSMSYFLNSSLNIVPLSTTRSPKWLPSSNLLTKHSTLLISPNTILLSTTKLKIQCKHKEWATKVACTCLVCLHQPNFRPNKLFGNIWWQIIIKS